MMQFVSYLSSPCELLKDPFSLRSQAMHRNMNSRLGVVLLLMVISVIGYVLTDSEEVTSQTRFTDFIGLDGELSILPLRCSTCALIGTSGHLLKRAYGSKIDENHTCIFRLGFSPVRGMESSVGARTTARIVDSFSFFPFIKRPWKLMSGSFNSEAWILYGRRAGDITWFHRPLLSTVAKKHDTKFLWMTKKAESEVYSSLKNQVSKKDRNKKISSLWFALKVAKDAGCTSLNIYGIPDHQICKRHMDIDVTSLYWENRSNPVCRNGVDASFTHYKSDSFESTISTIPERRVLLDWLSHYISEVNFYAPYWPS